MWDTQRNAVCLSVDDLPARAEVAFGASARLFVGAYDHDRVHIYRCEAPDVVHERSVEGEFCCIDVADDDAVVAVGTCVTSGPLVNGRLELYRGIDWEPLAVVPLQDAPPSSVAIDDQKKLVALGDRQGRLFLVDVAAGRLLVAKQAHFDEINAVDFSPGGARLATASDDGNVHIWDVRRLLAPEDRTHRVHNLEIPSVSSVFLADSEHVATVEHDGNVLIWNAATGDVVRTFPSPRNDLNAAYTALSPDGKLLGTAFGHWPLDKARHGMVEIRNLNTGEVHGQYELPYWVSYSVPTFSSDGRFFALSGVSDSHMLAIIIDLLTKETRAVPTRALCKGIAFSPDGATMACCLADGTTQFFDVPSFEFREEYRTDETQSNTAQYSPDGRLLLTAGMSTYINLLDVATGEQLNRFRQSPAFHSWVRFSADGTRLLSVSIAGTARLWHVESGEQLLAVPFDSSGVWPTADFAPDGRSFLVTCGRKASVFRIPDTDKLAKINVAELLEVACDNLTEVTW